MTWLSTAAANNAHLPRVSRGGTAPALHAQAAPPCRPLHQRRHCYSRRKHAADHSTSTATPISALFLAFGAPTKPQRPRSSIRFPASLSDPAASAARSSAAPPRGDRVIIAGASNLCSLPPALPHCSSAARERQPRAAVPARLLLPQPLAPPHRSPGAERGHC